jgi:FkbM family methyltransferase
MYYHNGIALLEHDTHLSKWVVEHNRLDFDQNVLPFVLPHIKEGDIVLDAGANLGCYSFAFLNKIGDNGHLYAFEPATETYECLEHNLNTFDNATLFNMALSYKKGYCKVLRPTNNVGMNFCEEVANADSIKVTTIDSLTLPKLDFIKLDVEGDELNVLIGGYNTIKKFKPKMFIEINEHTLKRKGLTSLDLFNWLDKNGYVYTNVYPNEKMKGDQYDIIAIHNEKL